MPSPQYPSSSPGFPFSHVCNLLQRCEDNAKQFGAKSNDQLIKEWVASHCRKIAGDKVDLCSLISTLLPTRRPDRVYSIQIKRLTHIVARAHCLGRSRIAQLEAWQRPGSGKDFAECVEDVLSDTRNTCTAPLLTVEEVDQILHGIAAGSRFSSPKVQSSVPVHAQDYQARLQQLYTRLEACQAKWLTRLVLKDYSPVQLNPTRVLKSLDPLLPVLVKIYDDLPTAVTRLVQQRDAPRVTACHDTATGTAICSLAARFKPVLGVKVGRQDWIKGRSIKHCMQMGRGRMSVEKKIDGEFCQVHVDLSRGTFNCIQIFAKSGKDSTNDRVNLHPAIMASLGIGGSGPGRVKTGCILEGELVVYSEKEAKILPFEKIRKHVSRAGTYFHRSDDDSQGAHSWERLMIIYYDVLMIDGESLLGIRHSERFNRLENLVKCSPGVAAIVDRQVINFENARSAASELRQILAQCIVSHDEGLVLKADDPYFDFDLDSGNGPTGYRCAAIKLKKEYVGNFGDVGDFAIVGARYDPVKAKEYDMPSLKWTHFYVGCLTNQQTLQMQERPRFTVVGVVELNKTQMEYFARCVSPDYNSSSQDPPNSAPLLNFEKGIDNGKRPTILFPQPPVFDLGCFSFTREANVGKCYTMRFPMVSKIHCDRTWRDAVSFDELQNMAKKEMQSPQPEDSQELKDWIARLEDADPRSRAMTDSFSQESGTSRQTTSQESFGSEAPPDVLPSEALAARPTSARLINAASRGGSDKATTHSRAARACNPAKAHDALVIELINMSPPEKDLLKRKSIAPAPDTRCSKRRRRVNQIDLNVCSNKSVTMPPEGDVISCSDDANASKPRRQVNPSDSIVFSSFPAPEADPSSLPSPPGEQETQTTKTDTKCKYHGKDCAFKDWVLLLSPCVANFPWATEDLLGGHGVYEFETDVAAWNRFLDAEDAAVAAATSSGHDRPVMKKKMIIVDGRRREATKEFLMKIEVSRQERRDRYCRAGFAEVFDWRVLEAVMEQERKTASNKGELRGPRLDRYRCKYEFKDRIWRKHYVGLV